MRYLTTGSTTENVRCEAVAVRRDGSVESIIFVRSSGVPANDDPAVLKS